MSSWRPGDIVIATTAYQLADGRTATADVHYVVWAEDEPRHALLVQQMHCEQIGAGKLDWLPHSLPVWIQPWGAGPRGAVPGVDGCISWPAFSGQGVVGRYKARDEAANSIPIMTRRALERARQARPPYGGEAMTISDAVAAVGAARSRERAAIERRDTLIREALTAGRTHADIAEEAGVDRVRVSQIAREMRR